MLTLALAALAIYAAAPRQHRADGLDPLALLALLGLMRCVADPTPLEYNFVDVLIPLAVWETVALDRAPVATAVAAGVLWLATERLVHNASWVPNTLILTGSLALAWHLARRALGRAPLGLRRRFTFRGQQPITGS